MENDREKERENFSKWRELCVVSEESQKVGIVLL